jgi:hypothetical protein
VTIETVIVTATVVEETTRRDDALHPVVNARLKDVAARRTVARVVALDPDRRSTGHARPVTEAARPVAVARAARPVQAARVAVIAAVVDQAARAAADRTRRVKCYYGIKCFFFSLSLSFISTTGFNEKRFK